MHDATRTKTLVLLGVLGTLLAACSGAPAREVAARASVGSENAAPAEAVLLRYQPPVGLTLRTDSTLTVLAGRRVWAVMTGHRSTTVTRVVDGVVETTHREIGADGTHGVAANDAEIPSVAPDHVLLADAGPAESAARSALPTHDAPTFEYRDARHRAAEPSWGSNTRTLAPGASFPAHAVRLGDRWDDEAPVSPTDPAVRYHVFYRLAELEGEGDTRRATIDGSATRTAEVDGVPRTSVYESHSTYDVTTGVLLSFVFHIRTSDEDGFIGGADFELTTRIVARP